MKNPYDKYHTVSTYEILHMETFVLRNLYQEGQRYYGNKMYNSPTLLHTLVQQELVKRRALEDDSTTEH